MKKTVILSAVFLATVSTCYTSCKKDSKSTTETPTPATPTPSPTLYEQVGGTTMVQDPNAATGVMIEKGRLTLRSVVDSSIYVIAGDSQMQPYFQVLLAEVGAGNTTGFAALSQNFTDFMCSATGATNPAYAYQGKSMKSAHNPTYSNRIGMKVNSADFDKFVGDIGTGLAQNGVTSSNSPQLVSDLVALLNTTKSAIVQR